MGRLLKSGNPFIITIIIRLPVRRPSLRLRMASPKLTGIPRSHTCRPPFLYTTFATFLVNKKSLEKFHISEKQKILFRTVTFISTLTPSLFHKSTEPRQTSCLPLFLIKFSP